MAFFKNIPESVLVIAPFPPSEYAVANDAAAVVHGLVIAGVRVKTVSAVLPSYCSQPLVFAPKRRFEPALQEIMDDNQTLSILYPQALGFNNIRQKTWKKRKIEEFRRLKFIAKITFQKPKVIVAYPTKFSSAAKIVGLIIILGAKLYRPFCVKLVRKKSRGTGMVSKILGKNTAMPDAETAESTLFELANLGGNIRLTPVWFRKSVETLPRHHPLKAELLTLSQIISKISYQPLSTLPHPAIAANDLKIDKVNDLSNPVPLSGFMVHIREKLGIQNRFPIDNPNDRLRFIRWYITKAPETLQHPLPLPDIVFEAFKDDCKNRAHFEKVTTLRQPDARDVILPSYFRAIHRCYGNRYKQFALNNNENRIAFALQLILDHSRFQTSLSFLGKSLTTYFTHEIGGIKGNLSRLELLVAIIMRAPMQSQDSLKMPWASKEIQNGFNALGQAGHPLFRSFHQNEPKVISADIHITGTGSYETGLGRNQQMSLAAVANIQPVRPIFMHHINADEIPSQILRHNQKNAFHIGFLLWEFEKLPRVHLLANDYLDEIFVPSGFVKKVYETGFRRPVTMIGKGFDLPDVTATDMSIYGFDKSHMVFLTCFDMHSSVARKNPLAAVKAFQRAFPLNRDVRFILKTTPPPKNHWGDPGNQMQQIFDLAAQDNRIVIDQRMLPFADLLSLVRGADCIVSPHRSEGFGYLPAYALKYAQPVICTDYSGTKDFCTPETAFPVSFSMRKVKKTESILRVENAYWAEIDIKTLAQTMLEVQGDLFSARQRAKNGQALMLDFYSADALAKRYHARLDELGLIGQSLTQVARNGQVGYGKSDTRPIDCTRHMSPVTKP